MHGIFYGGQSPKSGEAVLGADLAGRATSGEAASRVSSIATGGAEGAGGTPA